MRLINFLALASLSTLSMAQAPAEKPITRYSLEGEKLGIIDYPTSMPLEVGNGDYVTLTDALGAYHVGLFWNKSIFWTGSDWKVSGNFTEIQPGTMTEKELYRFRRKWLKYGGHL